MLPVSQTYTDGRTVAWDDPAAEGQEEPEHPAPTVTVTEAQADGHGSTDETATAAENSAATTDNGIIMGWAGLIAGLLGLAAGVTALVLNPLAADPNSTTCDATPLAHAMAWARGVVLHWTRSTSTDTPQDARQTAKRLRPPVGPGTSSVELMMADRRIRTAVRTPGEHQPLLWLALDLIATLSLECTATVTAVPAMRVDCPSSAARGPPCRSPGAPEDPAERSESPPCASHLPWVGALR